VKVTQSGDPTSKAKGAPVRPMKAYRGNRRIAPLTLNHGTRWKVSG
jgi:hypothetical protein